jgi:hypothetical protein
VLIQKKLFIDIRENIKISAKECIGHCEAKHHKPWFDEECLILVD